MLWPTRVACLTCVRRTSQENSLCAVAVIPEKVVACPPLGNDMLHFTWTPTFVCCCRQAAETISSTCATLVQLLVQVCVTVQCCCDEPFEAFDFVQRSHRAHI